MGPPVHKVHPVSKGHQVPLARPVREGCKVRLDRKCRSASQRRQASCIPVEQPTKFEFVVNLTTAKMLGIDIPPAMLSLADEVLE